MTPMITRDGTHLLSLTVPELLTNVMRLREDLRTMALRTAVLPGMIEEELADYPAAEDAARYFQRLSKDLEALPLFIAQLFAEVEQRNRVGLYPWGEYNAEADQ